MPRGGKQSGAGRPRDLPIETRETIAREYRDRMWAAAAARAMARDPELQRRRAIDKQMRGRAIGHLLPTHDQEVIWFTSAVRPWMERMQAKLGDKPYPVKPPTKRAKGCRKCIIAGLAKEFHITERMVVRCINEFDFGT
jgi:hypothetical protein